MVGVMGVAVISVMKVGVLVGVGVTEGGRGVFVRVGVFVRTTAVFVGTTGVLVGGTGVLVAVAVSTGVLVGTGVFVLVGRGVFVGVLVGVTVGGTGVLVRVLVGMGVLVLVGTGVLCVCGHRRVGARIGRNERTGGCWWCGGVGWGWASRAAIVHHAVVGSVVGRGYVVTPKRI